MLQQQKKKPWSWQTPAKELDINWGPEERGQYKTDPNLEVEVFELRNGSWLHIQGDTDVKKLPSGHCEVHFQLKVDDCNSKWCEIVEFLVTLPNGKEIKRMKSLTPYIGMGYRDISIGKFQNNYTHGKVGFEMKALVELLDKSIVVRGVNVRPSAY